MQRFNYFLHSYVFLFSRSLSFLSFPSSFLPSFTFYFLPCFLSHFHPSFLEQELYFKIHFSHMFIVSSEKEVVNLPSCPLSSSSTPLPPSLLSLLLLNKSELSPFSLANSFFLFLKISVEYPRCAGNQETLKKRSMEKEREIPHGKK